MSRFFNEDKKRAELLFGRETLANQTPHWEPSQGMTKKSQQNVSMTHQKLENNIVDGDHGKILASFRNKGTFNFEYSSFTYILRFIYVGVCMCVYIFMVRVYLYICVYVCIYVYIYKWFVYVSKTVSFYVSTLHLVGGTQGSTVIPV